MSANIDKTRAALVKRFRDNWATGAPATLPLSAIEMPNAKFDRPSGAPYGRLSLQLGRRTSVAIGAARIRMPGVLFLQVFQPEDTGTKAITDGGDHFASIFDNQTVALLDASGFIRCGFVSGTGQLTREGYEQETWALDFEQDANR